MDSSHFRPAWWLPGRHAQTLGARLIRSWLSVPLRRERVELADGDFLDLDWVAGDGRRQSGDGKPLVVVLHGLEGNANSGYARQLYRELTAVGLQPVGLNFRGCSGEPNRLARAYHSGETGDLAHIVGLLAERNPGRAIGAVGVSLGGNVLLKYLGETGHNSESRRESEGESTDEEGKRVKEGKDILGRRDRRETGAGGKEGKNGKEKPAGGSAVHPGPPGGIAAAAAISVPFDLSAGADHIERGFSKTYRRFLVRKLQRKVRAKEQIMRNEIDFEGALQARSFREFDQAVIVPIHGFDDAEDYYRKSSSNQFLGSISVPTLLIHSLDDPFLPSERVPQMVERTNPHVDTEFTQRGGHVGFVSGNPWSPVFWGERRAAQFLAERLGVAS